MSDKIKQDEKFFRENFNTKLSKDEEIQFLLWADSSSRNLGRNILMDEGDYDIRGFWKNNPKVLTDPSEHGPDTYKKPSHPTFSDESIYNGAKNPNGGVYTGGHWLSDGSYIPSPTMLRTTHSKEWLEWYMKKYEPNTKLLFPVERK